ncbi:MAG: hypothetical protein RBR21_03835 [Bacteroidales bacterium]|nr:hypothetical protein [Bacteroidales bacterium]
MKKKVTLVALLLIAVIAVVILILFSTGTIPTQDLTGTIKKSSKYKKQQTTASDIILRPDILQDSAAAADLAINLGSLTYILENISFQTTEIVNYIVLSGLSETDKEKLIRPLNDYAVMIEGYNSLIRTSSQSIIQYLNDKTSATIQDIDKSFQDINSFFNRYKSDFSAFTNTAATLENFMASNDQNTRLELILNRLYAVTLQNAQFLNEKEIQKEYFEKIMKTVSIEKTIDPEKTDNEDITVIVYDKEVEKFRLVNEQTLPQNSYSAINFNQLAASGALPLIYQSMNVVAAINSAESLPFLVKNMVNSATFQVGSQLQLLNEYVIQSMAIQSMEKYSGIYAINLSDLKNYTSQQQLNSLLDLPKGMYSINVKEELQSFRNASSMAANALDCTMVIFSNESELNNYYISFSTLGLIVLGVNNQINQTLNSLLPLGVIQFYQANSDLGAINLQGSLDLNTGIHSQIGLDFMNNSLGAFVANIPALQAVIINNNLSSNLGFLNQ